MYKSPIDIVYGQMEMQLEGHIMKAVQNVHVNVDKEELLRALQYDRDQYKKGYDDAMESIVLCKDCESYDEDGEYCKMWCGVRHPEHFCGEGERKDNG